MNFVVSNASIVTPAFNPILVAVLYYFVFREDTVWCVLSVSSWLKQMILVS